MSPYLGSDKSLELFKETYRPQVKKMWCEFITFHQDDFCDTMPQEDDFLSFLKILREKTCISRTFLELLQCNLF